MASGNGAVVQFAPVNTGDMTEIPPDLPAGGWEATCSVKKAKTSKDSFPMLILEWKTTEALTDGNEDFVGAKVADFLVFFPATHKASRMGKVRLKGMCEALGIEIPAITKIASWDDLGEFIAELDGLKSTIYTTVEERKDTGELVAKVRYTAPGGALKASAADDEDEDEDSDDEPPAKKKAAIKPALKNKARR